MQQHSTQFNTRSTQGLRAPAELAARNRKALRSGLKESSGLTISACSNSPRCTKALCAALSVISCATVIYVAFLLPAVMADPMSSSNYKIQSDSINFAGDHSTSASYTMEDTVGEVATGITSSTNFTVKAGYQQMQETYIAVSPAADVAMSPAIGGITGGIANGSTSFTVTTDDQAGYSATLAASSSPALVAPTGSFADYVPAGAAPDFAFGIAATASAFAFTPEGADIDQRFKDNGVSCNAGSSDTADACWAGPSTSPITIADRTSANQPAGTLTTLKFRAASGASHVQPDGVYVATSTVTVTAL